MAFYYIRWIVPGQEPRGSQTFATEKAARSHARRSLLHHPRWSAEVVRHEGGEQTTIAKLESGRGA
jgi:hypothetical protein